MAVVVIVHRRPRLGRQGQAARRRAGLRRERRRRRRWAGARSQNSLSGKELSATSSATGIWRSIFGEKRHQRHRQPCCASSAVLAGVAGVAGMSCRSSVRRKERDLDMTALIIVLIATLAFAVLAPVAGLPARRCSTASITARMQGRVGPAASGSPTTTCASSSRRTGAPRQPVTSGMLTGMCALLFAVHRRRHLLRRRQLPARACSPSPSRACSSCVAAYINPSAPTPRSAPQRETLQVHVLRAHGPVHGRRLLPGHRLLRGQRAVFDGATSPVVMAVCWCSWASLFILTIKLRKSPFDLSMAHHAHQELVRGITTEMSGAHPGPGGGHALVRERACSWAGSACSSCGATRCRSLLALVVVVRWCTSSRSGSTTTSPA